MPLSGGETFSLSDDTQLKTRLLLQAKLDALRISQKAIRPTKSGKKPQNNISTWTMTIMNKNKASVTRVGVSRIHIATMLGGNQSLWRSYLAAWHVNDWGTARQSTQPKRSACSQERHSRWKQILHRIRKSNTWGKTAVTEIMTQSSKKGWFKHIWRSLLVQSQPDLLSLVVF